MLEVGAAASIQLPHVVIALYTLETQSAVAGSELEVESVELRAELKVSPSAIPRASAKLPQSESHDTG